VDKEERVPKPCPPMPKPALEFLNGGINASVSIPAQTLT